MPPPTPVRACVRDIGSRAYSVRAEESKEYEGRIAELASHFFTNRGENR